LAISAFLEYIGFVFVVESYCLPDAWIGWLFDRRRVS